MDDIYIYLLLLIILHACLLFFDFFFKSCSLYPYLYFLNKTGLHISPFRISWFTSAFNRQLQKWGTSYLRLQSAWFSAGAWVSIAIMPISVCLIIHTIYTALKNSYSGGHSTIDPNDNQVSSESVLVVEPLIPGWNLPTSDMGYYLITLFLSSVIHELGHAMAAVREDVHVAGFTVTLLVGVPVVLTHLDQVDSLSPLRQLRIYCAGVWHNLLLALVAALLATLLPVLVYPFYDYGTGVQIVTIKQGSGISKEGGLSVGDLISKVNECPVYEGSSWYHCLSMAGQHSTPGFCIPDGLVREHDESVPAKHNSVSGGVDCCDGDSLRHLCFEYIGGSEDEPLPLPQHTCLVVRTVVEASSLACTPHSSCPTHLHCFRPSLENSTKLVRLYRSSGTSPVLFLGHPGEVLTSALTTDFIPLHRWLSSSLPDCSVKLCHFLTMFSSGLAILNIIPCFYFDGQHILRAFLDIVLAKRVRASAARHAISLCMTILGSLLLSLYLIVMLVTSV